MKEEKTTKNLETKNLKNHIRQSGRWYGLLSPNLASILLSLCSFIEQTNSFFELLPIITTSKPTIYSCTNHNTQTKTTHSCGRGDILQRDIACHDLFFD